MARTSHPPPLSPLGRGAIAPGDLAAAFATLRPRDDAAREAIAEVLGLGWRGPAATPPKAPEPQPAPPPRAQERAAPPELSNLPLATGPAQGRVSGVERDLTPAVRSRLTRERTAPRRLPDWIERAEPLPRPAEGPAEPGPGFEPLLPPGRERGILSVALATRASVGELDLPAVVDAFVRGVPLTTVPRRPVATLARGVQLLLDVGDAMLPYLEDLEQLEGAVRAVAGDDRVDVVRFAACPTRGAGRGAVFEWSRQWSALRPPAGVRVVCVSDLGIGRPPAGDAPADPEEWLAFHDRLRAAGCPLLVFNPYRPARWPPRLARRLPIVHWSREATAAGAARAARQAPWGGPARGGAG